MDVIKQQLFLLKFPHMQDVKVISMFGCRFYLLNFRLVHNDNIKSNFLHCSQIPQNEQIMNAVFTIDCPSTKVFDVNNFSFFGSIQYHNNNWRIFLWSNFFYRFYKIEQHNLTQFYRMMMSFINPKRLS